MVGLIYEILADKNWNPEKDIYVECIPGVSSLNSCSALIGSPLMTDFAVVSMSDLLVPWDIIVKRVEAALLATMLLLFTTLQARNEYTNLRIQGTYS